MNEQILLGELRQLALSGLQRMYIPQESRFAFRLALRGGRIAVEGVSDRYTAIALIGMRSLEQAEVDRILDGHSPTDIVRALARSAALSSNVGDIALTIWAANLWNEERHLDGARERLVSLAPWERSCATVELSWVITAACVDAGLKMRDVHSLAGSRLLSAFNARSGVFPHVVGSITRGLRDHVSCFADFVYPIQALSIWSQQAGNSAPLEAAGRCASRACELQGKDGQWWWHFDVRTGRVIEPYPVYSVHQHGMGPMALLALAGAGGPDNLDAISRSLSWLRRSPEIDGTLIDRANGLIWRKVARREPRKLARTLQAAATYTHQDFRVPGIDAVFPATAIDRESRPYELGWLLYALNEMGSFTSSSVNDQRCGT